LALAIAIWFVTKEGKVLLKRESSLRWGEIYSPIEGYARISESILGMVKRNLEEQLGDKLTGRFHLQKIDEKRFFTEKGGPVLRYHFLCSVLDQQLSFASHSKEFLLVGKEDLPRIKRIDDSTIVPENDIVLHKDPHDVFCKILENFHQGEEISPFFIFCNHTLY